MNSKQMDLRRLAEMIKDIKFTMLTTVNSNGAIESRPMATQKIDEDNFDGTLWFFTKKDSAKVHSIEHDQHVNLAYASPEKQKYISISGSAQVIQDKEKMKDLWSPMYRTWFSEGIDDPEISLISVKIDSAEIWDTPPSKAVQLVGYFKSMITGKTFDREAQGERLNFEQPQ